jgi:hypothetical protein
LAPISFLEMELAHCGLQIIDHIISPLDLTILRQNFLAKRKQKVFDKIRIIGTGETLIAGAWGTDIADQLFGAEVSETQFHPLSEAPFDPRLIERTLSRIRQRLQGRLVGKK